jgi:hypothetical protein
MQKWVEQRYGKTNIGWPWVLTRLVVGLSPDDLDGRDLGSLSPDEDAAALALLKQALREVVPAL